jgi:hypothetical protein
LHRFAASFATFTEQRKIKNLHHCDGFWIGWSDLLTPYTLISWLQVIQRYHWSTHFTVHRCTHTRVVSLQ